MAKGCAVCRSLVRDRIDRALASGQSPNHLARVFRTLSRPQIREHRARCLLDSPKLVRALQAGALTYEEFDALLRNAGNTEEESAEIVSAVRGRLEADVGDREAG